MAVGNRFFLTDTENARKNKCTFHLNLGRYIASKFQNPPFYLYSLADTLFVKFFYTSRNFSYEILQDMSLLSYCRGGGAAFELVRLIA